MTVMMAIIIINDAACEDGCGVVMASDATLGATDVTCT
jgi:hypothetical protein